MMTTSMSSNEREAFEQVASLCRDDVQRLCGNSNENVNLHEHVGSMLDEVMRTLSAPESLSLSVHPSFSLGMDPPLQPDVVFVPHHSSDCSLDDLFNHVLAQFMPLVATNPQDEEQLQQDPAADLARALNDHANRMLASFAVNNDNMMMIPSGPIHVHIARRLSEVTPEQIQRQKDHAFLPFSSQESTCLETAARQGQVSFSCGAALSRLHHVRQVQLNNAIRAQEYQAGIFSSLFLLYSLVAATALVLFVRRRSLPVRPARILRAIYSRPELKRQVELELDHDLGPAPPSFKGIICARKVCLVGFILMAWLVLVDIIDMSIALSVCVALAAFLFLRVLFWNPVQQSADQCACCCCGSSPSELTQDAACCACCQGTGVCSVACASCCGKGLDCCCSGNVDDDQEKSEYSSGCCGPVLKKDQDAYLLMHDEDDSKIAGAHKKSNPVVADKSSNVSTASLCCGCACCSSGCCGGTCCGCCCSPKKKPLQPSRHEIYEGVPVQVV